jgi:hypothetical protein
MPALPVLAPDKLVGLIEVRYFHILPVPE